MSKAILVLDMPEDCHHCILRHREMFEDFCSIDKDIKLEPISRPEACPLRFLPGKKALTPLAGNVTYGKQQGWNECVDEIENSQ